MYIIHLSGGGNSALRRCRLLTKPVAVVYHLAQVFTGQIDLRYIQGVEFRYMMSPDLFCLFNTGLVRERKAAIAINREKLFARKQIL